MKKDLFNIESTLNAAIGRFRFYSLQKLQRDGICNVETLPFAIRILLEDVIRNFDDFVIREKDIENIINWQPKSFDKDISFMPARILMQDFTGVPGIVDIASIRSEIVRKGFESASVNPLIPVDLIIDHSVKVDFFGTIDAFKRNVIIENERNRERYQLLKWAQKGLNNFRVVPPGLGICHQVNLEYLAKVVITRSGLVFPDSLVGTDSHTPMVNGIGVLGWGVGGIEAEAALLGQPINMLLPEVIGLKFTGKLPENSTATDLVLRVTEMLRSYGVVGRFVEVFGEGLNNLTVPDRATISNMSPEFGCTMTYFPPDGQTMVYMKKTGREKGELDLIERYLKENMVWRENEDAVNYTDVIELDLSTIEPSISGPKRPQDRIPLREVKKRVFKILRDDYQRTSGDFCDLGYWEDEGGAITTCDIKNRKSQKGSVNVRIEGLEYPLRDGAIAIAAITSCTNTSNPIVMLQAALLAKNAVERGLCIKPWVKTSLAPGSKVVTRYLEKTNLLAYLEALRFHVVGYGCTTCIGNSGPLKEGIAKAVTDNDLVVASVLSGNRNFEARIHPLVKMNFLASPPLVVAYALAGRIDVDLQRDPLGYTPNEEPVYLRDIWPSREMVVDIMNKALNTQDFLDNYHNIFEGEENWGKLPIPDSNIYEWDKSSTYIKEAPFFKDISSELKEIHDIKNARALLILGDSITTDHISPAGSISLNSPAGKYLIEHGVKERDFNSYGSRRGNHEVMVRGTFANPRLRNLLIDREGGWTIHFPSGLEMTIYEASVRYKREGTPLIILAGKEYGSGSSRDWAAKGTCLLGIKAVIAESFERIHRSNLVGMGVLPLQFKRGENYKTQGLTGRETFNIIDLASGLSVNKEVRVIAQKEGKKEKTFKAILRLDSDVEISYYKNGGILPYVIREKILKA